MNYKPMKGTWESGTIMNKIIFIIFLIVIPLKILPKKPKSKSS